MELFLKLYKARTGLRCFYANLSLDDISSRNLLFLGCSLGTAGMVKMATAFIRDKILYGVSVEHFAFKSGNDICSVSVWQSCHEVIESWIAV